MVARSVGLCAAGSHWRGRRASASLGCGHERDFSDPTKAALEALAEDGRLAGHVDEFKSIVTTNGGYMVVKCAFQMISKSEQVARKLDDIAFQLGEKMGDFAEEMAAEMQRP